MLVSSLYDQIMRYLVGSLGTKTENIEKLSTSETWKSGHVARYSTNTRSCVIKEKWAVAQVIVLVSDPKIGGSIPSTFCYDSRLLQSVC